MMCSFHCYEDLPTCGEGRGLGILDAERFCKAERVAVWASSTPDDFLGERVASYAPTKLVFSGEGGYPLHGG